MGSDPPPIKIPKSILSKPPLDPENLTSPPLWLSGDKIFRCFKFYLTFAQFLILSIISLNQAFSMDFWSDLVRKYRKKASRRQFFSENWCFWCCHRYIFLWNVLSPIRIIQCAKILPPPLSQKFYVPPPSSKNPENFVPPPIWKGGRSYELDVIYAVIWLHLTNVYYMGLFIKGLRNMRIYPTRSWT